MAYSRTTRATISIACALLTLPASWNDAAAQRREIALEANPFHGTLSYGWGGSAERVAGVELGFGFPQLDRTLVPSESLVDFFHIGGFLRRRAGAFAFDGRAQLGLAELRGCSGCVPGLLGALSGGVFVGGRRVKVGSRLTVGVIAEQGNEPATVLNLTPFAVLVSWAW